MSIPTHSTDLDLTNLNWVSGTPVPINCSVSPTESNQRSRSSTSTTNTSQIVLAVPLNGNASTSTRHYNGTTPQIAKPSPPQTYVASPDASQSGQSSSADPSYLAPAFQEAQTKPKCSYTCLIGMALKASERGCLPVNEIYRYLEREFPYFRTAPDGWKNSIRHNLSLNHAFQKVERTDGWHGKKGYFWEINVERKDAVEREVNRFLKDEGRKLGDHSSQSTPIPSYLHASVPSMPKYPSRRRKATSSTTLTKTPLPPNVQIQQLGLTTPISKTPTSTPRRGHTISYKAPPSPQPIFDSDNIPSQYIGIEAPTSDPNFMARDLFGLDFGYHGFAYSPAHQLQGNSIANSFSPIPAPQVVTFLHPSPNGSSPSPVLSFSGTPPGSQISPLTMAFTPSPIFYPVPPITPLPPLQLSSSGSLVSTSQNTSFDGLFNSPFSLMGLESADSIGLEDLLDIIDKSGLEMEDPLGLGDSAGEGSNVERKADNGTVSTGPDHERSRDTPQLECIESPSGTMTSFELGPYCHSPNLSQSLSQSVCESLQVNCGSPPDIVAMLQELNSQTSAGNTEDVDTIVDSRVSSRKYTVDIYNDDSCSMAIDREASTSSGESREAEAVYNPLQSPSRSAGSDCLTSLDDKDDTVRLNLNVMANVEVEIVPQELAAVELLPHPNGDTVLFKL